MTDNDEMYEIDSRFYRVGKVNDIPLSDPSNGLTRKVLRAETVDNPKSRTNTVRICLVHQKRQKRTDEWQDIPGTTLKQTQVNLPSKFQLDTAETRDVFEQLANLYAIAKDGVHRGKEIVRITDPNEWIRVGTKRAELIRQLIQSEHSEEIWQLLVELQPDLSEQLSAALLHQKRKLAVEEFESSLGVKKQEQYWKDFLRKHPWMFGGSNVRILEESRLDIKNNADIPFEVDGGFMDLVELKRPDSPFWLTKRDGSDFKYRDKLVVPHFELEGAIAQTELYILQAEKKVNDVDFVDSHQIVPLKPRGLVVHGRSHNWTTGHWRAFRLLNDRLHGVQVMTFDHLLAQAKRSLAITEEESTV